ncbi:MAG: hypothetical protein ACYTGN_08035 [Planctomycetota bacterium]
MRRLLKWFAVLVLALAVAGLVAVWGVLGVNPFEGEVDQLWQLTSTEVDLFVRFPAVRTLLDEPLVEAIEREPGFEALAEVRTTLAQATADIAREVNPQIPLGAIEIDLDRDFLSREAALGGAVRGDFRNPRFDNFIFLVRVPFYARFVSALKRGFVRDQVQGLQDVELINGLYFRLQLPPDSVEAMAPFRSARPRPQGDDVIYMTRIGDVVAVSDSDIWIEHALQRGVATLSADAWFESDFIRGYEGGNRIEAFFRPTLTANLMYEHARRGQRGPLNFLRVLLPPKVMGELVARAAPAGPSTVAFEGSAALANDGFDSMDGYLQSVYNAEKGDLRYDFSDEGIGRVVPDRRTLAAAVVHAKPEDVLGLAWTMLLPEEKSLADDQVRGVSRRRGTSFTTFQQFAEDLVSDLGDTHAVVVSRPSRFVGQRYETFEDESDPPLPGAGLTVTLVSTIGQNARPEDVVKKFERSLEFLGLEAGGDHKSGKFKLAALQAGTGDEEIVKPAYGILPGTRYFVFSMHYEVLEAMLEALDEPERRFVNRPGVDAVIGRLPVQGSLGFLVDGATARDALFDRVRLFAANEMDVDGYLTRERKAYKDANRRKDPPDEEVANWAENYIIEHYDKLRTRYLTAITPLEAVDAAAFGCNLGVGAEKKVVFAGGLAIRAVGE